MGPIGGSISSSMWAEAAGSVIQGGDPMRDRDDNASVDENASVDGGGQYAAGQAAVALGLGYPPSRSLVPVEGSWGGAPTGVGALQRRASGYGAPMERAQVKGLEWIEVDGEMVLQVGSE